MKPTIHRDILKRVGCWLADKTDCGTLESLLDRREKGLTLPETTHIGTAANAHIKYNADHAMVHVSLKATMLPFFCEYFGLDAHLAKELYRDDDGMVTYRIRQSTRGGNGTKLTERRHNDTSSGAELFAIFQQSTSTKTMKADDEFHFVIKTATTGEVDSHMETVIYTLSHPLLWAEMLLQGMERKQQLLDQLQAPSIQPDVLKRVGCFLADRNDCATLESLLEMRKKGRCFPKTVHSQTAANAYIKYNVDHAMVLVCLAPGMLPAFCDYFGLDPQSAKEVERDGQLVTYQIRQATSGGKGTKLTRRRHADSSPGAELFVIWQCSTNPESFTFDDENDERHYEIKIFENKVDSEMERIVQLLSGHLWEALVKNIRQRKQRLIDQLNQRDPTKLVSGRVVYGVSYTTTAPMSKAKSTKKKKNKKKKRQISAASAGRRICTEDMINAFGTDMNQHAEDIVAS